MQEESNHTQEERKTLYQYIYGRYSPAVLEKARALKGSAGEMEAYAAFLLEKIYRMYCERVDFSGLDDQANRILDSEDGSYEAISYFTEEMHREFTDAREASVSGMRAALVQENIAAADTLYKTDEILDTFLQELDVEHEKLVQGRPNEADVAHEKVEQREPDVLVEKRYAEPQADTAVLEPQNENALTAAEDLAKKQEQPSAPTVAPLQVPEAEEAAPLQAKKPDLLQDERESVQTMAETGKKKKKKTGRRIGGVILIIILLFLMWVGYGMLVGRGIIPGVDFGYSWVNQNIYPFF